MRTTVDIPDSLMERAKKHKGSMTFRPLVISALEKALAEETAPFVLQDASAGGVAELRIADRAYSRFPMLKTRNPLVQAGS
ncbi:hypothetical protein VSU19_00365 [Verrucomicrobiales bacterium BCK34]|nr:hypothetical protein [Verrucomicrobiales bacterium BCK34]